MNFGRKFQYLRVRNAYGFGGEHRLDLEDQGLTSITGLNLDAKLDPESGLSASNGSGKSTLLRCFVRVWFGARKACPGEKVTECMYGGKTGTGFLLESAALAPNGKVYKIVESRKSEEYDDGVSFYEDGVRIGLKNGEEAFRATFLKMALGLTFDEFMNSCVIAQNAGHVLINGTEQQCIEFIERLFGLQRFTDMYDRFKIDYDRVTAALQDLVPLRAERDTYTAQLEELPPRADLRAEIEEKEQALEGLKAARKKLRTKRDTLKAKLAERKSALAAQERMRAIRKAWSHEELDFRNVGSALADVTEDIRTLDTRIAKHRASLQVSKDVSTVRDAVDAAKARMSEPGFEKYAAMSIEDAQAEFKEMQARERKLTSTLEADHRLSRAREIGQAIRMQVDEAGVQDIALDKAQRMHAKFQEAEDAENKIIDSCITILGIREQYDTHLAHCPTCGTKVTSETIHAELAKLKAMMNAHEELRVEYHRKAQKYLLVLDWAKFQRDHEGIDLDVTDDQMRRRALVIQELRQSIRIAERAVVALEEIRHGVAALKAAQVQHSPDKLRKLIADNEAMRDQLTEMHADLSEYVTLKRSYAKVEVDTDTDLAAEVERVDAELEDIEEKTDNLFAQVERIDATYESARGLAKRLKAVNAKLVDLPTLERKERVLKLLCQAYGPKGLKVEKVSAIIRSIKEALPSWLRLTLTETNMRVEIDDSTTALKLMCVKTIRIKNKRGKFETVETRYPVKTASGGEQTRILIALIMTLLETIPEEKRMNVLFLDEPERGLDPANRYLVSEMFIPMLREQRESLFFITHSLELNRKMVDNKIVITRKNNTSSISKE